MSEVYQEAKKLAEEHWDYVERLIELMIENEMELLKFHYVEAFIHGYKHGVEDSAWIGEGKTWKASSATKIHS